MREHRRALALAWSAAASLLLLAGAAGWQWKTVLANERAALAQRIRAERTLAAYEGALGVALGVIRKLAATNPENAEWQRDVSAILRKPETCALLLAIGQRRSRPMRRAWALPVSSLSPTPTMRYGRWNLVMALYKVSNVSDPSRARAALIEALPIIDALARDGKLTAAQQHWPQLIRDALAKLPPAQAGAR